MHLQDVVEAVVREPLLEQNNFVWVVGQQQRTRPPRRGIEPRSSA